MEIVKRESFFLRFYLFIFREGKGERNRGRETLICRCLSGAPYLLGIWPTTQACALTGNHWRPFGSKAGAQSTEPHQPGLKVDSLKEVKQIKIVLY